MAEIETVPQEIKAQIDQIGHADLVMCLPWGGDAGSLEATAAKARQTLRMFPSNITAVLAHSGGARQGSQPTDPVAPPDERLRLLEFPQLAEADPLLPAGRALSHRRRALFAVGQMLRAQVCTIVETDLLSADPGGAVAGNLCRLIRPVLEGNQDLVVASYQRRRFDSLINAAIVYPLLRALYGKQVEWPMAPDFSLSLRLVDRYAAFLSTSQGQAAEMSPAWIVTEAVTGGFELAQARFPIRLESAQPGADLSTILAQLLGPLFLEMERDAPFWQKLRGSRTIPTFGDQVPAVEEPQPVDVGRMIESFQHGFRNLQEVWNLVLSPATIIGMKKVTMLAPDRFRMPDELWVRIVYDFALAFHLRIINRDHLLRALTPAYLAWVASYALEVKDMGESGVGGRIERLCGVYEGEKPYFQSRWRWPDRFNP